ncbi:MAG: hypothetical protein Q7T21_04540 [Gallionella sp.]|nr:hypothetical protein [Gallionella sp.]
MSGGLTPDALMSKAVRACASAREMVNQAERFVEDMRAEFMPHQKD